MRRASAHLYSPLAAAAADPIFQAAYGGKVRPLGAAAAARIFARGARAQAVLKRCPGALEGLGHASPRAAPRSSQPPPSLRRLPLSETVLADTVAAGQRSGPLVAYQHLVHTGVLHQDSAQQKCATELQSFWEAMLAHAEARKRWRTECEAFEAQRAATGAAGSAARSPTPGGGRRTRRKQQGEAVEVDHTVASRDPVVPTAEVAQVQGAAEEAAEEERPPPEPAWPTARGCFIWGGVGGGKSLLMDLFVESSCHDAGPLAGAVRRAHFHEFMLGVQHELRELRLADAADRTTRAVARRLAGECRVLALDEFQLTNISDALIVETLLDCLLAEGVSVVMTSNRPPEDLYKEGLNRHLVVPQLLALFQRRGIIRHELQAAQDWRLGLQSTTTSAPRASGTKELASTVSADASAAAGPWRDFFCDEAGELAPVLAAGTGHEVALRAAFADAAGADRGRPAEVPIGWGRRMQVGEAANRVGRFTFPELCAAPLNADDYLKLVESFHTFIVTDVPRFSLEQHNEARRFTNLIDCLYESHARLIVSAEAPPAELLACMEVLASLSFQADGARPARTPAAAGWEDNFKPPTGRPAGGPTADDWARRAAFEPPSLLRDAVEAAAAPGSDIAPGNDESSTRAGVAGVMAGALGSLQESGFAARRAISRLLHMQSEEYLQAHKRQHILAATTSG